MSCASSSNPSLHSSNSHLLNLSLNTDHYLTPLIPDRVIYPLIVSKTLITNLRGNPRFLYLASRNINSNYTISDEYRQKDVKRLMTKSLQFKFEITVDFHNLSSHPILSHTAVKFKALQLFCITANLNLFVCATTLFLVPSTDLSPFVMPSPI